MGDENYFVVDIETCPLSLQDYFDLEEEERRKLINPIDSRVVAIGVRYRGQNTILMDEDEKALLESFWSLWRKTWQPMMKVAGFNLVQFDMPFLVTRSFLLNVTIVPFTVKYLVDLRDKINAYRYGPTRGTLKEYGKQLGLAVPETDGGDIALLCKSKDLAMIRQYLEQDLEITDAVYKRARDTKILDITKW